MTVRVERAKSLALVLRALVVEARELGAAATEVDGQDHEAEEQPVQLSLLHPV